MRHLVNGALLGLATVLAAGTANAQVGLLSNTATVSLSATKASALTVAINSGATQTLGALTDNATNNFPSSVNITTAWDLNAGANVYLVGWFATPASALASGGNSIPSSWVKGSVNSGAFNAFSNGPVGGVGVAGGSLTLFNEVLASLSGSRTDNLDLQIDLTGQALVPGTYTGTLNLRAVVQ